MPASNQPVRSRIRATNPRDLQRVAYGQAYQFMPRRSILAASINGDDFLRDTTGNRRFWVVDLPQKQHIDVIDTDRIERDHDRIWKAAIAQYREGMQPMLSAAHQGQSDKLNEGYSIENPFLSAVEMRCLPELRASSGFPISLAIEQSLVCTSIEKTDDGDRIIQRPSTSRDPNSWLSASRNSASSVMRTPQGRSALGNGASAAQTTQGQ